MGQTIDLTAVDTARLAGAAPYQTILQTISE